MDRKEVYKIWAPANKKWVDWVRPVPFINIDTYNNEFIDYCIPNIFYVNEMVNDIAIIVDIDGVESVKEGIALSKLGFRPIPIFNGTNELSGCRAVTNNSIVGFMLKWGALILKEVKIEDDSSPAFLLDSNRLNRYKVDRSLFDNSWDVYPQDLPSGEYFIKNGITKILVRSECIHKDLEKILYTYQNAGLKILFTNGFEEPREVRIKKIKNLDF